MKIKKFYEKFDYETSDFREYDEYSIINDDIVNDWKNNFNSINKYINDIKHAIHMHKDFIHGYVIFSKRRDYHIIANKITMGQNFKHDITIFFSDKFSKKSIELDEIKYIKSLEEVSDEDPNMFLELYHKYIKEYKAPYLDVFDKEEFKHIIDGEKYNL